MQPFAPFTEEQFNYMAMGKARAWTWEMLAKQLDMPVEIVERIAWTHEKQWNRALTKAERLVARETISEVAVVLRKDIRNAEPQYHATLTNSLTRVLKLQQEYAPPRRPRPVSPPTASSPSPIPTVAPVPIASPTPTPTPTSGASLSGTLASLLAFFVLLGALIVGCWTRARSHERPELVTHEPTACMVEPLCRSGFSLTGPPAPADGCFSSG